MPFQQPFLNIVLEFMPFQEIFNTRVVKWTRKYR